MAVKAVRQVSSSTDNKEQKPSPPQENDDDDEETNVKSKYGDLRRYLKRTNSLTQGNITMFARSLGVDDTEFDSIHFAYDKYGLHEIKYQVVSTWKKKYGEEATDEWFAHSLDEVNLHDEAQHFRQGTSKRPMEETGSPGGVSDFKDNLPRKHFQSSHPYTSLDSCVSRESPPLKDIPQAEQGSSSPADAQAQQSTVEQQTSVQSWDLRIWILTVLMAILAFVVATYSLYHEQYAVTIIVVAVAAVFCLVFLVLTLKVTQKKIFKDYADAPVELRKSPELFSAAHDKCLESIKRSFDQFKRSTDYSHDVLFQVLYGLGGCGKTEIVSSYAWNNWERYTGGVFVLNGQSNSYIDFGFKKILEKMKMDLSKEEKTPNNIRRSVLNKLNERKDWLLIIDDADDPELLWQVLETSKPLSEGHILVTSRVKTGWDELSTNKIKKIQIEPLSEDDSAILLLRLTTLHQSKPLSLRETKRVLDLMSSENPEEHRAIMWLGGEQALHGLPLALKLASRYIAEHHISFQTYKDLYLKCNLKVLPASTSDPLTGWLKRHGLKPSYAVGLRSIVGKETINIMSLDEKQLQEDPISLCDTDLTKFREAIRETNKADFVKMVDLDKVNIVNTWSINYDEIKKESHTIEFLHLCSCLSSRIQVALFIDGAKYLNIGDLREFFIPRSLSGKYHGKKNIHMQVLELFKTLENVSFATNIVGLGEEEEHKRSLSRNGEYTIHHVLQQVVFLRFMSDEEKIKSFNSALSMLEMLFPKQEKFEDFRTNAVRDRHSILAFHTLAVSQHMLSLDNVDISGLSNIHPLFTAVSTYLFRLGRAKDAKTLCKAMLHISRLRKMVDNQQYAEELTYLGRAYFQTKALDKAERYFSDSIDVYKGITGEENIEVLKVKQRLGRAMQDNGDYMKDSNKREEIERLLTETLNKKKKFFENKDEKDHYTVAHALHQLGCFYQNTGKYEKAEDMLKESLEMRKRYWKKKYGIDEVEDVAIGMTLLARNNILNSLKDIEETKTILTSALEIKDKCMVSTNESYQLGLYYLAMFYHIIGDDSNSRDYSSKIEIDEYRTLFDRNRDEKDRAKVFEVEMVWM